MARFGDLWIPWVMAAERNMATVCRVSGNLPTGVTRRPVVNSGERLELLELATHLINRLIELLHPLLKQGIHRSGRWGGLHFRTGPQIQLGAWRARASQPQGLGQAALAAPIGFAQQPPTEARSSEHGSTEGTQQQAAAGAGWALPWISHGWVKGAHSP
jgi:hypothetical protein